MCTVTLMVPLSTKVLMGANKCNAGGRGGSDELESHPGGVESLLVTNCNTTETKIYNKLWLYGPLA